MKSSGGPLFCSVLTALLLGACGGAPLPESYGIYAQDGRSLVPLEENGTIHRVGPAATLLVFDKVIENGDIGGTGGSLDDLFAIHQGAFVRYEVERVKDPDSGSVTEIRLTPINRPATLATKIAVMFSPVKGESEMLSIKPREHLPSGLYSFRIGSREYYFLVGVNPDELPWDPSNRCQDKHSDTRAQGQEFSWADWMSSLSSEEAKSGNWLESSGYKDCAALDREAQVWRKAAVAALAAGNPRQAFVPTMLLKSYDSMAGHALEQDLLTRVQEMAEGALADGRWQEAADLASFGAQVEANNPMMGRILTEAQQRIADAAAAEKAESEARHAARLRAAYAPIQTLGRFSVLSNKVSGRPGFTGNDWHPIEITDASVRGLAYLRDSGWITSSNNLADEYWFCWVSESPVVASVNGRGMPAATLEFKNGWRWFAVFENTEKQAEFIETINTAKQAWYDQYRDLVVSDGCPEGS